LNLSVAEVMCSQIRTE